MNHTPTYRVSWMLNVLIHDNQIQIQRKHLPVINWINVTFLSLQPKFVIAVLSNVINLGM